MNTLEDESSKSRRFTIQTALLAVVLIASALFALAAGRYQIPAADLFSALADPSDKSTIASRLVWNVRLPRVLLAVCAGASLAAAGCAFQALFSNPLASPDTLGVATGASFGAALFILLGFSPAAIQFGAIAFGLAALALVYLIIRRDDATSLVMIILAGMTVSALFGALVSLVKYVADPQDVLPSLTFWLMGSLTGASMNSLARGAPLMAAALAVLFLIRWRLNIISLPEDEAKSLGVNIKRERLLVMILATTLTASVVSLCGLIGWIGLLVPHAARMLVGSNHKRLYPLSLLIGAILMLAIDTAARTAAAGEIPVSILTALIGAPFFIALLRRIGAGNAS